MSGLEEIPCKASMASLHPLPATFYRAVPLENIGNCSGLLMFAMAQAKIVIYRREFPFSNATYYKDFDLQSRLGL